METNFHRKLPPGSIIERPWSLILQTLWLTNYFLEVREVTVSCFSRIESPTTAHFSGWLSSNPPLIVHLACVCPVCRAIAGMQFCSALRNNTWDMKQMQLHLWLHLHETTYAGYLQHIQTADWNHGCLLEVVSLPLQRRGNTSVMLEGKAESIQMWMKHQKGQMELLEGSDTVTWSPVPTAPCQGPEAAGDTDGAALWTGTLNTT